MSICVSDSSSDDDSVFDEEQLRNFQRGGHARDSGASSSSYSDHGASPYHGGGGSGGSGQAERPKSAQYSNYSIPGNTARHALADVMQSARHCKIILLLVLKKHTIRCRNSFPPPPSNPPHSTPI